MLALLGLPSRVGAQTQTNWSLLGLRSGLCIQFLISPDLFHLTPFQAARAARASSAVGLDPVLARLVAGADSLAAWYPSVLCLLQADSSRTGNATQRHKHRPVTVALWTVLGGPDTGPAPVVLFSTEKALTGAEDLSGSAEVGRMEATLDVDPETGERVITARLDQSSLGWEGKVLPDTVPPGPEEQTWLLVGKGPRWLVQFHAEPGSRRRLTGSLRASGDGLVARLLAASPIRYIGQYWEGGTAYFGFSREP